MSLPRFSGSFCGLNFRVWLVVCLTLLCVLSVYRYISDLNGRLDVLISSRVKLEKAVTKLQLDSIDISRRHLSFADEQHYERESDREDDMVLVYNRVPKTGSTSFAGIAYELCTENHFHVIHMNISRNQRTLGLSDQMRFITNITGWDEKKPAIYHGHVAFIDFSRFGMQKLPIYINMVREPLERLISYYYFVRYGDDFKPFLKRRKAGDHESFDECVARDGEDCDPENLWVQIPYFCGHHADCWEPGNQWALEEAKRNVLHHYLVVGVTEELRDFLAVLEATLPRFFRGATALYSEGHKSHLRKTAKKVPPKPQTIEKIQESTIWKMENDFYEFVLDHFHYIKHLTFEMQDGEVVEKERKFQFEKIRPR
ncbi:heparan sulfate 2-O-sulfotransferase 1 [Aplysia californica]|uniref:Heparan sulfate 2-O-sulfotransferase 1 n=1 Tax=Aplysia californica TaxID=6500 RepID=A0ABM1A587_APLCA|nr:heparan sulfate 2-O-sulfotransferase 1 [Aplysia californica]XP_012946095.2 heparan sulfate 2-O-sulfotransferase 1 [Aplysia californica]